MNSYLTCMTLTTEEKAALDSVSTYVDQIIEDGVVDGDGGVVLAKIPQYAAADPAVKKAARSIYLTAALAMMRAGLIA